MGKKTSPTSIRFDEDHLKHALSKYGVDKAQALVDKMLDQLWRLDHPEPVVFAMPSAASANTPSPSAGFAGKPTYRTLLLQAKEGLDDPATFRSNVQAAVHLKPRQKETIIQSIKQ